MTNPGSWRTAMIFAGALACCGATMARAQPKTAAPVPAYIVAEVEVTDPAVFSRYAAQVPATLAPFGGRYLVRSAGIETLEGSAPKSFVVLAFDSRAQAEGWMNSPAYRAIQPLRVHATTPSSRLFLVEAPAPKSPVPK